MAKEKDTPRQAAGEKGDGSAKTTQKQVRIDTSQLKSSYCNVSNMTSTREEVVLNFGLNENWDLGQREVAIELQHRIILSPFAARRLQQTLGKLLQEYETRYGKLS